MSTLADRISLLLQRRSMTQAELAAAARVKPPSVADWVSGESKSIKAEPALRIAHACRVNAWWLVFGDGPMEPDSATSQPLVAEPAPARYDNPTPLSSTELVTQLAARLERVAPHQRREATDLTTRLALSPDSRMARHELAALLSPHDPNVTWRGVAVSVLAAAMRLGKVIPQDELIDTIDTNYHNAIRTTDVSAAQNVRIAP